jgi:hypothetical protein
MQKKEETRVNNRRHVSFAVAEAFRLFSQLCLFSKRTMFDRLPT